MKELNEFITKYEKEISIACKQMHGMEDGEYEYDREDYIHADEKARIFRIVLNDIKQLSIALSARSADRQLLIDFARFFDRDYDGIPESYTECVDRWLKSINNVGEQGD